MTKAKVTSKGQITIPQTIRERLGIRTGDEIEFIEDADGIHVRKHLLESPFKRYRGMLRGLKGRDPDDLINEIRGT